MIKKLVFILLVFSVGVLYSQQEGIDHHIEYGVLLGASNYTGDLSPIPRLSQAGPSVGAFYRHHLKDNISVFRVNIQGGQLKASEGSLDFPISEERDYSFNTTFFEFSGIYEYKFFDFRDIKGTYFMTPYIFGGLGTSIIPGSKAALVIPFGVGTNFAVGKKLNLGLEFGARKTFTDEIDGYNDDVNLNSSHGTDWYYFTGITISRTVYNPICPD